MINKKLKEEKLYTFTLIIDRIIELCDAEGKKGYEHIVTVILLLRPLEKKNNNNNKGKNKNGIFPIRIAREEINKRWDDVLLLVFVSRVRILLDLSLWFFFYFYYFRIVEFPRE